MARAPLGLQLASIEQHLPSSAHPQRTLHVVSLEPVPGRGDSSQRSIGVGYHATRQQPPIVSERPLPAHHERIDWCPINSRIGVSVARPADLLPSSACEPVDVDAARFIGATIRLFDVDVLVVQVAPRVIGDRGEAPALVAAFQARFQRTIVLVSRDRRGVPTFFGPGPIALVLSKIPFEALTWQRFRYRPPRPIMLPIPIDPPRQDSASYEYGSVEASAYRSADNQQIGIPTRDLGRRTRTIPG